MWGEFLKNLLTKILIAACVIGMALALSAAVPLFAQDTPVGLPGTEVATQDTPAAAANSEELRKQSQNPVASLISVPIQENFNFNNQPGGRTQNVLNIQPVIPLSVSKNWNLIVRWITPIVYQPIPVQPPTPAVQTTGVYGLGDMNPTFFLVPKKSKIIWGIGPTFVLPTATNTTYLGQGKLSVGPSFVALVQPGPWTIGALVNNIWSVAGPSDRADVNQMSLQYFINYNMKKGWFISISPTITANWQASSGNVWTVPVGGGVGRVFRLGFQPVNVSVAFFGNAVHPIGGSPWGMRLQLSFLFPKRPGAAKKD